MPTYTVRRRGEDEEWDVHCSYKELEEMCEEYDLQQVIKAPNIIGGVGNLHSKVPDGFKDRLKQIHKNSGMNSKVKT
jgi:hypothetical protein